MSMRANVLRICVGINILQSEWNAIDEIDEVSYDGNICCDDFSRPIGQRKYWV
ncbi:hypothetical protein THIX_60580 [Thiomonas sp. X19]|nr:hypothetical protein THIX_60580 [Thiomonas sp. X19]